MAERVNASSHREAISRAHGNISMRYDAQIIRLMREAIRRENVPTVNYSPTEPTLTIEEPGESAQEGESYLIQKALFEAFAEASQLPYEGDKPTLTTIIGLSSLINQKISPIISSQTQIYDLTFGYGSELARVRRGANHDEIQRLNEMLHLKPSYNQAIHALSLGGFQTVGQVQEASVEEVGVGRGISNKTAEFLKSALYLPPATT